MDYVYWSSADYPFDFLHAAIVKQLQDSAAEDDSDAEEGVSAGSGDLKVESSVFKVGLLLSKQTRLAGFGFVSSIYIYCVHEELD